MSKQKRTSIVLWRYSISIFALLIRGYITELTQDQWSLNCLENFFIFHINFLKYDNENNFEKIFSKILATWSSLLLLNSFEILDSILTSLSGLFNFFKYFFGSFLNKDRTFATFKMSGNWGLPMDLLIRSWKILANELVFLFMIVVVTLSLEFPSEESRFWCK